VKSTALAGVIRNGSIVDHHEIVEDSSHCAAKVDRLTLGWSLSANDLE
jgi:hypothetical protein